MDDQRIRPIGADVSELTALYDDAVRSFEEAIETTETNGASDRLEMVQAIQEEFSDRFTKFLMQPKLPAPELVSKYHSMMSSIKGYVHDLEIASPSGQDFDQEEPEEEVAIGGLFGGGDDGEDAAW